MPTIPIALTSLQTQVTQYDVEENIGHLMTLARIALERGDTEKAQAILQMGLKICDEYQSYFAMPYMYDILASIAFAMGKMATAESLLVQVSNFGRIKMGSTILSNDKISSDHHFLNFQAIEKMVQLGTSETDGQIVDFKLRLARIYSAYSRDNLADIGFKNCLAVQEAKISEGDTSLKTGILYVNVMFWYGLHKIREGKYNSAKQLIDSAYSFSGKIKGLSPYQEMVILYTLGDLNIQMEEYEMALENLHSAVLLGRGEIYFKTNYYDYPTLTCTYLLWIHFDLFLEYLV